MQCTDSTRASEHVPASTGSEGYLADIPSNPQTNAMQDWALIAQTHASTSSQIKGRIFHPGHNKTHAPPANKMSSKEFTMHAHWPSRLVMDTTLFHQPARRSLVPPDTLAALPAPSRRHGAPMEVPWLRTGAGLPHVSQSQLHRSTSCRHHHVGPVPE